MSEFSNDELPAVIYCTYVPNIILPYADHWLTWALLVYRLSPRIHLSQTLRNLACAWGNWLAPPSEFGNDTPVSAKHLKWAIARLLRVHNIFAFSFECLHLSTLSNLGLKLDYISPCTRHLRDSKREFQQVSLFVSKLCDECIAYACSRDSSRAHPNVLINYPANYSHLFYCLLALSLWQRSGFSYTFVQRISEASVRKEKACVMRQIMHSTACPWPCQKFLTRGLSSLHLG